MMFVVVLWIVFSILVGLLASSKGRSGFLFFFLALILSPVIGLIIALVMPKNNELVEARAIETGGMRKCPSCAELVKSEAKICKHCQSDLNTHPIP
ncbi:hypothetical protein UA24_04015 [Marinomonas sp. BSi20414]|nr:hypothetical protein [Marinomonas sp. BSi20414]